MICTVTLNTAIDRVLHVPGFFPGMHAEASVRSLTAAGKGINVARVLASLGVDVVCCGLVGGDQMPLFCDSLRNDRVLCRLTPCGGPTRVNTTIIDPVSGLTTHLREAGPVVGETERRRLGDDLDGVLCAEPVETVAFCGSVPRGLDASDLVRLLRRAGAGGRVVVLDTDGTRGRMAVQSGAVSLVKPNLEELQGFLGRPVAAADAPEAAGALLDHVQTVLLSLGPDGAVALDREGMDRAVCPVAGASVRSTVGCGDALLAGWLYGRQAGMPRAESLAWAVACATASACSEFPAGCTREAVEMLLPSVRMAP